METVPKWKQFALNVAEVLDAFRVVPRIIMVGYAVVVVQVTLWFMGIETPSATQMGFVNVIWGAAGLLSGWYMSTGRKWDKDTYKMIRTADGFGSFEGPKSPNEPHYIQTPYMNPYYAPQYPYPPWTTTSNADMNRNGRFDMSDIDQPSRPPPPSK